ncbi:hypothetical protein Tco_0188083, partial [Tanacetum coccineum]
MNSSMRSFEEQTTMMLIWKKLQSINGTSRPKPAPAKPQEKKRKPVSESSEAPPLPKVPGKGKEKVGEEQATQVLLYLQNPKEKSPADQYIFQRRTLSGSETEADEEMPSVVRSVAQEEGQARPDPGKLDEGQARPNPDDVAESHPLPTPSVLAGPNLEHSDVEIT